jgi:hypothetical protein
MKNIAFYHIFLTEELGTWSSLFIDQMKLIEDSGLFDNLEAIYMTAIGNDDNIYKFIKLTETYGSKVKVINTYNRQLKSDKETFDNRDGNTIISETVTLSALKKLADQEEFNVLYFHSKGITATENFLNRNNFVVFKNYLYWRKFLEWGVIERWQECVDALNSGYDTAGANFSSVPVNHYSGTLWWSKSSYIKRLPDPSKNDWWEKLKLESPDQWIKTAPLRIKDEMWVCAEPSCKPYSVKDAFNFNVTQNTLHRKLYTN